MNRASSLGSGRGLGWVSLCLNQLATQGDRNKEPWWPWSHLFCQSTCCHHPLWDIHCHSNTTPTACWAAQFHCGFRCLHLSLILYHLPANAYLFPLSLSVFFSHLPPSLTHTHSKLYLLSCALVWPTHTFSLCLSFTQTGHLRLTALIAE